MSRRRGSYWTPETGRVEYQPRKSIVVRCNHGNADGRGDFVQRFRFGGDSKWFPTDLTAEGGTYVSDNPSVAPSPREVPPPLFGDFDVEELPSREHFNARCKVCRRVVPMRGEKAQVTLTRLSDAGVDDISLVGLQRAYDCT